MVNATWCRGAMVVAVLPVAVVLAGGRAAADPARAAPASPPHILLILADDLGYADVGFHGSAIRTPNLDALAAGGARLEQFYVQPVCSPTRAALMTGRYPMRHGLQVGVVRPWADYGLPLEERTLAAALHEAGYVTAICGKWHLGHCRPEYLPTRRGFDFQYGHYNGMIDYFTHLRDGGHDWHRNDRVCRDPGYSTTLLADEAVRLIRAHDAGRPLLLYLPFNAVHSPWQVPQSYVEPYADWPEPRRTYAGMVAAMDEAIGRVLGALEEKQMRRNTLILFSSDNGGPHPGRVTSNEPFRAGKGTLYEGGVRVAALANWPGRIPPGTIVDQPLHIVDWYPTLLKLAGARLEQPAAIDGRDVWPTLAEGRPSPHEEILLNAAPEGGAIVAHPWKLIVRAAGGKQPSAARGAPDAASPGAATEAASPGRPAADLPDIESARLELYHLADDPSERDNLAQRRPDKARELLARYQRLAAQATPPKNKPQPPGFRAPEVWGEPEPLPTRTAIR